MRSRRLEWIAGGLLLALFVARGAHTAWVTSPTYDETPAIFAGYSYYVEHRFDRNMEHPPLAKLIVAAPLLLLRPTFAPDAAAMAKHHGFQPAVPEMDIPLGFQFLFIHNRARAQLLVFAARLAAILVAVAAAIVVQRWARALYGPPAGLLAMLIFTFDPNVLAHAANASGDIILTACIVGACFAWWRFLQKESWPRLIFAGLLLGAAVATRVFGGMAGAMFAVIYLAERVGRRSAAPTGLSSSPAGSPGLRKASPWAVFFRPFRPKDSSENASIDVGRTVLGRTRWRIVPQGAVIVGLAVLVLWASYGFEMGRPIDRPKWPLVMGMNRGRNPLGVWAERTVPLPNLLLGLSFQRAHVEIGHPSFLMGEVSSKGWWYYFPITFLLKTPIAFMLLVIGAVVVTVIMAAGRGEIRHELALIFGAGVYGLFCVTSAVNIGYRFLLPMLPLLCVLAGLLMTPGVLRRMWLRIGLVILCGWLGISSLLIHPHYMAYFNESIGGPGNGHKYLVDSNVDWGQALPSLKGWMDEHNVAEVNLSYFGSADPSYYGIKYQYLLGSDFLLPEVLYDPKVLPPAEYFAISATSLQGPYFPGPEAYRFFREMEPVGHAGHAILIYKPKRAPIPTERPRK